jgi:hypothetical protein
MKPKALSGYFMDLNRHCCVLQEACYQHAEKWGSDRLIPFGGQQKYLH